MWWISLIANTGVKFRSVVDFGEIMLILEKDFILNWWSLGIDNNNGVKSE